jgi:hypothetical protein
MPAAGGIAAEYGDRAAGLCGAQGGPPARRRASRASGSPRPGPENPRARALGFRVTALPLPADSAYVGEVSSESGDGACRDTDHLSAH